MRTTPYTTEEIKKLKESGKYYKDNPETMRLRFLRNNDYGKNTIGSIARLGRAACPPLPYKVNSKRLELAILGPY